MGGEHRTNKSWIAIRHRLKRTALPIAGTIAVTIAAIFLLFASGSRADDDLPECIPDPSMAIQDCRWCATTKASLEIVYAFVIVAVWPRMPVGKYV